MGIYVAITVAIWLAIFFVFIKGNILSKIVYGLEFYGNFLNLSVGVGVLMVAYVAIASIISLVDSSGFDSDKSFTAYLAYLKVPQVIVTYIFLNLVTFPLPSKNTVYLLLGSEISEEVVNTDIGKDIIEHVKEIIRDTVEGDDEKP